MSEMKLNLRKQSLGADNPYLRWKTIGKAFDPRSTYAMRVAAHKMEVLSSISVTIVVRQSAWSFEASICTAVGRESWLRAVLILCVVAISDEVIDRAQWQLIIEVEVGVFHCSRANQVVK